MINAFSIAIGLLLILLSLITPLLNPFFRKVRKSDIKDSDDGYTGTESDISVLLLAYDEPQELQNCISAILEQNYNHNLEIIVIIEKGDAYAENILSGFHDDKRIYVTFIPSRSLFMSRQKLAISLGVKAAHNEWITVIKSTDRPVSSNWLSSLSKHFNKETSLVIGYANYEQDTKSYYRFLHLRNLLYLFNIAQHKTAYRAGSPNIAFRKTVFINGDGYRDNLQLIHGEFDFIINKYAEKGNTSVEISPEAFIREEKPTKKEGNNRQIALFYMRKILNRSLSYKICYAMDLFMMYINYIAIIAMIIYSSIYKNYLLLSVSILALILTVILRTIIAKKSFKQYKEHISCIKVIPYEISLLFHDLRSLFKYLASDKNDFTTHKV